MNKRDLSHFRGFRDSTQSGAPTTCRRTSWTANVQPWCVGLRLEGRTQNVRTLTAICRSSWRTTSPDCRTSRRAVWALTPRRTLTTSL